MAETGNFLQIGSSNTEHALEEIHLFQLSNSRPVRDEYQIHELDSRLTLRPDPEGWTNKRSLVASWEGHHMRHEKRSR